MPFPILAVLGVLSAAAQAAQASKQAGESGKKNLDWGDMPPVSSSSSQTVPSGRGRVGAPAMLSPQGGPSLPIGGGGGGGSSMFFNDSIQPNAAPGGGFGLNLAGGENRGADGGFSLGLGGGKGPGGGKTSMVQQSIDKGSTTGTAPAAEKMGAWDKAAIAAQVASGLLNKGGPPLPNVGGFTPGENISSRFMV
jgi:hypothetical protein